MLDFLNPVFDLMGSILAWLYAIIPNYGVAIILLTILVRLVLYPLTAKQARSMIAMQRVQPEIKKLQAKYKDDKQKLNEEMMKFYKENKINPFGGCLPLLAQMPVFISLFRVLHDPQAHTPKDSAFYQNMCNTAKCVNPQMDFFGMNLSASAAGSPHSSFLDALPYWILVGLVVVTAYLQQRQTMKNNPGGQNPQAQMIGKIMPLVFAFISINLPAGVVLYFFVSNLWQMGQQEIIIRKMDREVPAGTRGVVDAKSRDAATTKTADSAASATNSGFLSRFTKAVPAATGEATVEVEGAKNGSNGSAERASGNGSGNGSGGGGGGSGKGSKAAKGSSGSGAAAGSGGQGSKSAGGSSGKSGGSGSGSNRRRSNKKRRR